MHSRAVVETVKSSAPIWGEVDYLTLYRPVAQGDSYWLFFGLSSDGAVCPPSWFVAQSSYPGQPFPVYADANAYAYCLKDSYVDKMSFDVEKETASVIPEYYNPAVVTEPIVIHDTLSTFQIVMIVLGTIIALASLVVMGFYLYKRFGSSNKKTQV